MTNLQFDALADLLRLRNGAAREAARLILVDGMGVTEAGRKVGVSRQSAGNAAERCRKGLVLAAQATQSQLTKGE